MRSLLEKVSQCINVSEYTTAMSTSAKDLKPNREASEESFGTDSGKQHQAIV